MKRIYLNVYIWNTAYKMLYKFHWDIRLGDVECYMQLPCMDNYMLHTTVHITYTYTHIDKGQLAISNLSIPDI